MKIEKEFLIFKRLLGRNRARPTRIVRAQPAAARLMRTRGLPGLRARVAYPTRAGGMLARPTSPRGRPRRSAPVLWSVSGSAHRTPPWRERLRHEPRQGLHREHPRRTPNQSGMARRTNSQLGGRATWRRKLTSAVDGTGAQWR
jgi:hypothetical protein